MKKSNPYFGWKPSVTAKWWIVFNTLALSSRSARQILMVKQRRYASFTFTKLSYTADGRLYSPPADVEARKAELKQKIEEAVTQHRTAEVKAGVSRWFTWKVS